MTGPDIRPDNAPDTQPATRPPLTPTGIPGLDYVLGGGIRRGSLVMIVGPPGSGKTTLATQHAFARAREGARSIIFTAFSEPSGKLIEHLGTFTFFDHALLGEQVQVLSLQAFLERGLAAAGDEIVAAARQARAELIVLDGFSSLRTAASSTPETREFLYAVSGRLAILGLTTMITSEAEPRDTTLYPEATTADVIIGIYSSLSGVRQRRGLEVIKARGASPRSGLHGFAVGEAGVAVYPRLESRVVVNTVEEADDADDPGELGPRVEPARVRFDLPELDTILGGGLTRDTQTLLLGQIGTGKTILALHFALAGVRAGEHVVYFSLRENRRQLLQKATLFGLGEALRAALAPGGGLTLVRLPSVELDTDLVTTRLLDTLDQTGARRLVIDSVAELERQVAASDERRMSNYAAALVESLRARGITALLAREIATADTDPLGSASNALAILSENVIILRRVEHDDRQHRVLAVQKMGFSAFDPSLREFAIVGGSGVQVFTTAESASGVLTAIAIADRAINGRPAPPPRP